MGRPRHYPEEGLEASRKVGWAKFYVELERADGYAALNHQLRERIEVLLEALVSLVDSVLTDNRLDAFAQAHRVRTLIDEFRG